MLSRYGTPTILSGFMTPPGLDTDSLSGFETTSQSWVKIMPGGVLWNVSSELVEFTSETTIKNTRTMTRKTWNRITQTLN